MYIVELIREFTQNRPQDKGIEFIKRRVLSSKAAWEVTETNITPPETNGYKFVYRAFLTFNKTSGQKGTIEKEWQSILDMIEKVGASAKFRPCVWRVKSKEFVAASVTETTEGNARHAMSANTGITLEQVRDACLPKIVELLTNKDAIAESEYFCGIFEREAQIRVVLSSIKSFLESNGERRNHILLFGLPACAKTQILNAITHLVSEAAVVRLDGTSTTPAGIYKTYFENFNDIPEPPFVVLEEAEKTSEESLRVWLGVLDERGELRKVNYREQQQRNMKILCMATANDKHEFDMLMGGTERKPGALSSRFAHQIQCPRPSERILRMILERDINEKGGSLSWVDAVIDLAHATQTNDPRKVLSYLDGAERLETGEYQADILAIHRLTIAKVITNEQD